MESSLSPSVRCWPGANVPGRYASLTRIIIEIKPAVLRCPSIYSGDIKAIPDENKQLLPLRGLKSFPHKPKLCLHNLKLCLHNPKLCLHNPNYVCTTPNYACTTQNYVCTNPNCLCEDRNYAYEDRNYACEGLNIPLVSPPTNRKARKHGLSIQNRPIALTSNDLLDCAFSFKRFYC